MGHFSEWPKLAGVIVGSTKLLQSLATGSGGKLVYNGISVKSTQIPFFLGSISATFVCHHNSRPTNWFQSLKELPRRFPSLVIFWRLEPIDWPTVVMADELAEIKPRKKGICVDLTLIPLYTNFPCYLWSGLKSLDVEKETFSAKNGVFLSYKLQNTYFLGTNLPL